MQMIPPGEYIQVRNQANSKIEDLCYAYDSFEYAMKPLPAARKENFMIITSLLKEDHDLVFYFKHEPSRKFVFSDAVKKMTPDSMWTYFFAKVVETDGILTVEHDPEAEAEHYAFT